MKHLLKCTSLEVAAHRYYLQAYAYRSCKVRIKHMLYVLGSVLCTSCGSSGVPTEPDQDAALNANAGPATAGEAIIIDPGNSTFFVESQVTDQSPIANVSNQIPQIGAAIGENETEADIAPEVYPLKAPPIESEVNAVAEVSTATEDNTVAEIHSKRP